MMEWTILIRDVWRLLASGLDAGTRKHLGLVPKQKITERMVSYSFGLIAAALNSSVHGEANAALLDESFVREVLGVVESEELDPFDHATLIDEVLEEKAIRLAEFVRKSLAATPPSYSFSYCCSSSPGESSPRVRGKALLTGDRNRP
jgi:hypothetical protein